MMCRGRMSRAAAILAAMWLGMADLPATGQEKKAPMGPPAAGTVLDPAGSPVPGCKVWAVEYDSFGDPDAVGQTVTDGQGRFSFPPSKQADPQRPRGHYFVARDSKGRIGWPQRPPRSPTEVPPSDRQQPRELTIRLVDVQDYRGRLVDASGRPIAKATIRPLYVSGIAFPKPITELAFLPAELAKEMGGETAADGSFVLRGVPAQGTVSTRITATGFGSPGVSFGLSKPVTVRLEAAAGSIAGSFVCAADPVAAGGIKYRVHQDVQRRQETGEFSVGYWTSGVSAKDGAFRFDGVPPGKYVVNPEIPQDSPYYADAGPIEVKPGQAVIKVSVELKRGVLVQGKVVDAQGGAAIKDVQVYLSRLHEPGRASWYRSVKTDSQGVFKAYAMPGKIMVLNVYGQPEGYLRPSSRIMEQSIEVPKETRFPPIQLERATGMEGIVVDSAGKTVADAEIRCIAPEERYFSTLHERIRSDAAGKFSLKNVSPKHTIIVRARTDKAAADPVNVSPAEAKGPIRLVVSEQKAFGLRGLLVDDSGQPLKEAAVELQTHWRFGSSGIGFQLASLKTDGEGRFVIGGLWAGDGYNLQIVAEGCEKFGSREVQGVPGKTHDFGKIVLARARGVVEGVVVDSADKPIADARVFNSGDGPEPMSTRIDAAGRFRLAGFRSGPVFVFAEKEGYRFTGLATTSGSTGVTFKMLRKNEPLPPQRSRIAAVPEEELKKHARRLLERLWSTGDRNEMRSVVSMMGRLDLEKAQKWSAEAGKKYDHDLLWEVVQKTADADLDEALGLLVQEGGVSHTLVGLAQRYIVSDPPKAMRCAEEAVIRARSLDQPQRALALAEAGALVMRLGNQAGGRKVVEEAADMAAKMGSGETWAYYRAKIAATVAAFDPQRAMKLVEGVQKKEERDRLQCNVAGALDDLKQADTLLQGAHPFYSERARIRLACRMAAKDPAEAVRYVENMPKSQYSRGEQNKAQAFGLLAVAIGLRDKTLACSLIDRAYAIFTAPSDERMMDPRSGASTLAAILAVQARQIGYPDMECLVYRTLALRPTTKDAYNPAAAVESVATMAMLLAMVDADVAKRLLTSIESQSDAIGSGYSGVGRETWFKAWALADPEHAMKLLDRELASAKEKTQKQTTQRIVHEILDAWTVPPPAQLKNISRRLGVASPDEEF